MYYYLEHNKTLKHKLRLGLGYKALVFASTANLELGPSFADIC